MKILTFQICALPIIEGVQITPYFEVMDGAILLSICLSINVLVRVAQIFIRVSSTLVWCHYQILLLKHLSNGKPERKSGPTVKEMLHYLRCCLVF